MTIDPQEEAVDYKNYLAYHEEAKKIVYELSGLINKKNPHDGKIVGLINRLKHVISKRMQLTKKYDELEKQENQNAN